MKKQKYLSATLSILCTLMIAAVVFTGLTFIKSVSRLINLINTDVYWAYNLDELFDYKLNGKILTEYRSPGGDVVIGDDVTVIGAGAFHGIRLGQSGIDIDSLYLSDSVEIIERSAFFATDAEWVRLPEDIKYIGDFAFGESSSIKKIYFDNVPDHHIEISPSAFAYSSNIEFVNFPEDIIFVDDNFLEYK